MAVPELVGSAATPPAGRAGRVRRIALLVARIAFTTAVVGAVAYAVVRQWTDVRDTFTDLAWPSVLLSLVMVLAGLAAQTLAMQAALRDLGHPASVRVTGQIYLIGLLAKYLPGSIWTFLLQMELGKRARIPRSRVFVAAMLTVALSTTAALVLGVFGLPVLLRLDPFLTAVIAVLVPAAVVCAHPRVLTWLVQRFLTLARRPRLDAPMTWRGVTLVLLWSGVGWICFGVHLWLLAATGAAPGFTGVARCVGALALGLTVGMLAFLSPSGLGVREAMITAVLLPYVPEPGTALGMALASRLIFTVAELIAAGAAALGGLRAAPRHADPAPEEPARA